MSDIKMGDVFDLPIEANGNRLRKSISDDRICGYHVGSMDIFEWADAAAHAINNHDRLTAENEALRECVEDTKRLTREMDVAINGANAADQASLCDIVAQARFLDINALREEVERLRALLEDQQKWMDHIASERDQLQADNQSLQMKHDLLLAKIEAIQLRECQRDAEVIERAIEECAYKPFGHATRIATEDSLKRYANQLRQQAKDES